MVTYVTLNNFTSKAAKDIKSFAKWNDEIDARIKELGVEVLAYYLVMGVYDEVVVWTAPSEEVAVAWLFEMAQRGNRETVTMRAFNYDEVTAAVDLVP